MKQMYGYSRNGDADEALKGISDPKAVIFISGKEQAESAAAAIEEAFPEAAVIGCVGKSYAGKNVYEDGLLVIGYTGVEAVAGVIENVGSMPLASIEAIKANVKKIQAGKDNTVCVDFATGNDAELVTTMNIALLPKGISLVGGDGMGRYRDL